MVDLEEARREHGYHRLAVKAVVDETPDTRSYVLEVPDELADLFGYRAGQFCTFRVRLDDGELLRCYSMSSAPEVDADLAVTVKRVPGGAVSNWFHDEVTAGDVLEVTRPAGVFCLDPGETGSRPVLAFCGGSGVTPVMSLVKATLASGDRPVRVLTANRDAASIIFDAEWARLEAEHPDRLRVVRHLDDAAGFLDAEAVAAFLDGQIEADCYVCGPAPFMDLVESSLLAGGVVPERIHIERFIVPGEPAELASDEADSATPAEFGEPGEHAEGPGDVVPDEVVIILKGTRTTVPYHAGDTVLDTARRGGLTPPFSCEAGNCATCMALQHEGTVRMRANNALAPDEVEEGWILTCQSLPHGPTVVIEYEDL